MLSAGLGAICRSYRAIDLYYSQFCEVYDVASSKGTVRFAVYDKTLPIGTRSELVTFVFDSSRAVIDLGCLQWGNKRNAGAIKTLPTGVDGNFATGERQ